MAEENTTQAKHLTKLDFDISDIPNQMEEISKLAEKYAKEISETFSSQKIDIDLLSGSGESVNSIKDTAKKIKQEINESFSDITGDQSVISKIFSKEDIEDAKERLLSLISVYGRISKIKIDTDGDSDVLKASVTSIDDVGRQLVETFQLQKKEIKDFVGNVVEYRNEWEKVGSTVTENLEKQRKYQEQQENQLKKNIDYLDKQIEKQKDLTTKYSVKTGETSEITKQSKALQEQLEIIQKQVKANKEFTESEQQQTEEIIKQSRQLERQYKSQSSGTQNTFLSSMDALKFTATQRGLDLAEDAARNTLETMKMVEDEIVNITRVFSDANLDMEQFTQGMFDLATSYGRSFSDASEVVLRFAQAGYDASDSMQLAETTMLALNTAELDLENSTNSLIGIMQQWNLEMDDFPLLIDKINYAADSYAVTSQDLVDGLLRVSSSAKNANITFDETVGALVAMREASGRTGKEVGTALNSLITFTQKAQMDGTLEGMGINVYADSTKTSLKGVLDIWEELSEKVKGGSTEVVDSLMSQAEAAGLLSEEVANYAGLSEELLQIQELENQANQQNITDLEKQEIYELGKTYRRNYFIALLENFNKVQEVANDLQNAEGHSMQENSKYMDTLTAKYEQFIASLQELAYQAGESGLMDLAKDVLTLATNFNEFLGSVGGAETALMLLLGIIIQVKGAKLTEWGKDLIDTVTLVVYSFQDFTQELGAAKGAMGKLEVAGNSLSKVPIATWVGIGVTALAALSAAIKKARSEAEEQRQEIIDQNKSELERIKSLQELSGEYESLINIQDKTKEQEEELLSVYEKIEKALGSRADSLKNLKKGSEEYTLALKDQISAEEENIALMLKNIQYNQEKQLEEKAKGELGMGNVLGIDIPLKDLVDANDQVTELGKNVERLFGKKISSQSYSNFQKSIGYVSLMTEDYSTSTESIYEYFDLISQLKEAEDERIKKLSESEQEAAIASEGYQRLNQEINKMTEDLGLFDAAQSRISDAFYDLRNQIPETADGFENFINLVMKSTGLGESFRETIEDMARESIPVFGEISEAEEEMADEAQKAADEIGKAQNQYQAASESLSNLQSAYDTLAGAVSEYNATGQLSIDTLKSLLSLEPQYLAQLVNENGQLKLNHQAFIDLANAELGEMQVSQLRIALNTISQFKSEAEAIKYLSQVTKDYTEDVRNLNVQLSDMISKLSGEQGWSSETANKLQSYVDTINANFDAARKSVQETFTTIPQYSSAATSAASAAVESFYDQQTEAFERLNRMGQKTTQEVVDFYRQMTKSGKLSASERLDAEEKLFDAIKKQIQEALDLQIEALNKQRDALEKTYDAQIDRLNAQKEAIEDSYNSQKEALEDQKEAIEDRYDAELDALDEVEKEKDRAREREEYYRNREDILEDLAAAQRRSGIDARKDEQDAKDRLEELDREYQETLEDYELEDRREAIEAEKEAQLEAIEEQMDALDKWRESSIESIEASIEAVEAQKEAELEAIDEQIATLNEKFSESQINMLAYQAMTNEELYNQYRAQFIEPMANGMYDGFVQANNMMVDAASYSAQNMLSAYENQLIAPLSQELASIGGMLNEYISQIESAKMNAWDALNSWKQVGGYNASKSDFGGSVNNVTINNTNSIWSAYEENLYGKKLINSLTSALGRK